MPAWQMLAQALSTAPAWLMAVWLSDVLLQVCMTVVLLSDGGRSEVTAYRGCRHGCRHRELAQALLILPPWVL